MEYTKELNKEQKHIAEILIKAIQFYGNTTEYMKAEYRKFVSQEYIVIKMQTTKGYKFVCKAFFKKAGKVYKYPKIYNVNKKTLSFNREKVEQIIKANMMEQERTKQSFTLEVNQFDNLSDFRIVDELNKKLSMYQIYRLKEVLNENYK